MTTGPPPPERRAAVRRTRPRSAGDAPSHEGSEAGRRQALPSAACARQAELHKTNAELEDRAEQLALSSRYKSEFLANMSHELRSPLNSLLLLAEQLRQNREQNLTARQLEMLRVMDASGRELLHLINDILDLSKIEAGAATVEIGDVTVAELAGEIDKTFRYHAEAKALAWSCTLDPQLPQILRTDGQRVRQLLTNLLSNSLKFTSSGSIALSVGLAKDGWSPGHQALASAPVVVAFSVHDTGIGIAPDKRKLIFEAFQQADASTSRRYGGTGLGLAISREIARLLGGELTVQSEEGSGSTFTFYLPQPRLRAGRAGAARQPEAPGLSGAPGSIAAGAAEPPLLLIIEDDPVFARSMEDLARERGWRTEVAASGAAGLELARRDRPCAVTLDLELPDIDGWEIADRLRADPVTAAIPVHVISVRDCPVRAGRHGVASYTTKPADLETLSQLFAGAAAGSGRPLQVLLLLAGDPARRQAITAALAGPGRTVDAVATVTEARAALRRGAYQGIVIAADPLGEDGIALLEEIRTDAALVPVPVLLCGHRELDPDERGRTARVDAAVAGGPGHPPDAQAAQVAAFLQQVEHAFPDEPAAAPATAIAQPAAAHGGVLSGKRVMIVDDDVRNLFALTGLLESQGMLVEAVDSGKGALDLLEAAPGIDLVLMDIMMPDMDGYEAMRRIRANARFAGLPIIALTAKAMPEDRDRCLAAGASDYATKPVDTAELLSKLRDRMGGPGGRATNAGAASPP